MPPPRQNSIRRWRPAPTPASDTDFLQCAPNELLKFAQSEFDVIRTDALATRSRSAPKAKLVCAKNTKWLLSKPHKLQNFVQ
ncbi:MAG: hypothetical protein DME98_01355 [Verrucomicrobia bacterium]|nr:MAG: hypothetical protein DME98_01355 [Verrucomicrobiota bacterium]